MIYILLSLPVSYELRWGRDMSLPGSLCCIQELQGSSELSLQGVWPMILNYYLVALIGARDETILPVYNWPEWCN